MAYFYKELNDISEEMYSDIIVGPMLNCLKTKGILLQDGVDPNTTVTIQDIHSEFFLQDDGIISFFRTTTTTENYIDNSSMKRYTLIQIKGFNNNSNVTESMVNDAFKMFEEYLLENGFGFGDLTEGGSIISHKTNSKGCYIATAVYGSYECSEVCVLRRYRDFVLQKSRIGRVFIICYYAISPKFLELFGNSKLITSFLRLKLDSKISYLRGIGFEDTPYKD